MDKKMDKNEPPPTAACGPCEPSRPVASLVRFQFTPEPSQEVGTHLVEVPADVVLAGRWLPGLRREERLADEPENQLLCGTATSDEVRRDWVAACGRSTARWWVAH